MGELTKKEKGFVKDYIATDNGTQSALKHYDIKGKDKNNIAAAISTENLTKPHIIKAIAERLPDDLLEERHLELLNKREYQKVGDEVIDSVDVMAVSKGLDMAYKIKGSYAPEKHVNLDMQVNITPEALAIAKKYEEELKKTL